MQKYIKLYIDSQVCDLPAEDFGIELSYRASNGFTPAGKVTAPTKYTWVARLAIPTPMDCVLTWFASVSMAKEP